MYANLTRHVQTSKHRVNSTTQILHKLNHVNVTQHKSYTTQVGPYVPVREPMPLHVQQPQGHLRCVVAGVRLRHPVRVLADEGLLLLVVVVECMCVCLCRCMG